ncbi:Putative membrane protein YeiH [Collimonas arenae]|uniref:Putative membrane protein YeiH n=1 Tax=Collimonas arenae TaxID=279058 RepID=A0A0A1FBP8_9BURK|nr:YeiH family protein [Collimonas arenae]AIY41109.1 Putative membrane protein YeiH [Collimonas arenae]
MENAKSQIQPVLSRKTSESLIPGVLLCLGVTAIAMALQSAEEMFMGRAWLESLVLAILLGTCIRSFWAPGARWLAGIKFSSKTLLEIAVVLLGVNVSARMISDAGGSLLFGIIAVVFLSILISYGFGRAFGLPHKMAVLIACGNSICGNSAIAAVAPIIDAHNDDVAGAIAFTAVLGVAVVLGLPMLAQAFQMKPTAFGVLAGLTVYAVPQVLAATAPISSVSAQIGTLVKLVRVLMLGPVVLMLSVLAARGRRKTESLSSVSFVKPGKAPRLGDLVPWFIVGFIVMIGLRSANAIPHALLLPIGHISNWLTVISMAALGLGVDVRQLARAGLSVTTVVTLSLLALGCIAWVLIQTLGLNAI